ncbi:glycosyltransferase family 2 protein [Cryomorpha ignava]|uniref:Glycosyltransferase family 2 protein n=1 Tax=Cryomorpha ignava TaxID=101383 RepID=A0A7K3WUX7_9FLAO|nr:glycosyltransferase family 2 protein [Cryomorpha ignava]NEN24475.1 glycosyltransferase family 2 protein [Cryomorpha ignava]
MHKHIDVVIPAFNESEAVGLVVRDIPKELVRNIVVVDNNSSDNTRAVAESAGAIVIAEGKQGYGAACLKGLSYLASLAEKPDIVVFLDADYSDYPQEMFQLVAPILDGEAELVIGSRSLGNREKGAMMPQQVFGNWLATTMMKYLYGAKFTDLGPFRAITWRALQEINMKDQDYGWTVEMQVKALKLDISYAEIPVKYRKRKGVSKITGTIKGTVMAGYKIILTILRYA